MTREVGRKYPKQSHSILSYQELPKPISVLTPAILFVCSRTIRESLCQVLGSSSS